MVWIPGGTFKMGSDNGMADQKPVHNVTVDGFFMDETEVTVAQFAEFVKATNYVTVAERKPTVTSISGANPDQVHPDLLVPGALVLVQVADDLSEWHYVPGADWRHPEGPGSSSDAHQNHPVTQVAYEDAVAYCNWAGKQLPTEAQFEYAARAGHDQWEYVWPGDSETPDGKYLANYWQGEFPVKNEDKDGFPLTAPVKSFPPNDFGLFDMAGNVWEWCSDWYRPDAYKNELGARNPQGPADSYDPDEPGTPKRVVRGGSFLCSSNYCSGYRPGSRMKSSPDTALFHTGFRCVINVAPTK